jgi:hypothetical protein
MAAVTISLATVQPARDMGATTRRYFPTYTGPTLYAAGGDTGLATALGVGKIVTVLGTISNGTAALVPWFNQATGNLMWFTPTAEAAGDLHLYTGVLEVIAQ